MLPVTARMTVHTSSAARHSSSKRCIAIINPAGGNGRVRKLWNKLCQNVEQQLRSGGFSLEQRFTTGGPAKKTLHCRWLPPFVLLCMPGHQTSQAWLHANQSGYTAAYHDLLRVLHGCSLDVCKGNLIGHACAVQC